MNTNDPIQTKYANYFLVPPRILTGEANEEEYNNWIKICIFPILVAFEVALNKDLLLPSEKEKLFFAFDTTELTQARTLKNAMKPMS